MLVSSLIYLKLSKSAKFLTWAFFFCLSAEKTQKPEKKKQNGVKNKKKERRKLSAGKKKERWKSENGSLLKELGKVYVCVGVFLCSISWTLVAFFAKR